MLGRTSYLHFFVDWFAEAFGNLSALMTIVISGSIFIGVGLYINSMAKDLENVLNDDGGPTKPNRTIGRMELWLTYAQQIDFHIKIIM